MYYFYNRGLGAILTTQGWITWNKFSEKPYLLLALSPKENPPQVQKDLSAHFKKGHAKHLSILNQSKIANKQVTAVAIQPVESSFLTGQGPQLVAYIIKHFKTQQITSQTFFPLSNMTLPPTNPEPSPPPEPPQNLELDEEKYLTLKSSLSVETYQLPQQLLSAATSLSEILQQIQDISTYYPQLLKDIDAQIEDELHYLEFTTIPPEESAQLLARLQNLRIKRRYLKDSIYIANLLPSERLASFAKNLNGVSQKIKSLDKREYQVRAPEDFPHQIP